MYFVYTRKGLNAKPIDQVLCKLLNGKKKTIITSPKRNLFSFHKDPEKERNFF